MATRLTFQQRAVQLLRLSHPISFHVSAHVDRLCHNTSAEDQRRRTKFQRLTAGGKLIFSIKLGKVYHYLTPNKPATSRK